MREYNVHIQTRYLGELRLIKQINKLNNIFRMLTVSSPCRLCNLV